MLTVLISAGIGIGFLAIIPLYLVGEKYSLGEETDARIEKNKEERTERYRYKILGCIVISMDYVPHLLYLGDLLKTMGTSIFKKFFIIFLAERCHLDPLRVNILLFAVDMCSAFSSYASTWIIPYVGRLQFLIFTQSLGTIMLLQIGRHKSFWTPGWEVPIFWLISRTIYKSSGAITKTMMMDYVPKKKRNVWNALDSVKSIGGSGLSIVGGFLIDKYDFSYPIYITCVCHFTVIVLRCLLYPVESKFMAKENQRISDRNCKELKHVKKKHQNIEKDQKKSSFHKNKPNERMLLKMMPTNGFQILNPYQCFESVKTQNESCKELVPVKKDKDIQIYIKVFLAQSL
jgi:MFS family permease